MRKLRLREVVCPRLRSWGKTEPGLKSRPGGLQGPSLFHDTTQLLEVGGRLRIVGPDCQMQTDFAEAIPKQVLFIQCPREHAGRNVPVGSHCHLVAT